MVSKSFYKIWIWDRRFFKYNCNGVKLKETGKLSDPDAGHYVKKTGEFGVLTGTGYTDTCFVGSWWGLPVYWDAIGAHENDNTIFKNTMKQCMKSATARPVFIISDAGPDSYDANKLVLDYGIIPVIAARVNSVGDIIKQKKETASEENTSPENTTDCLEKFTILEPSSNERTPMM